MLPPAELSGLLELTRPSTMGRWKYHWRDINKKKDLFHQKISLKYKD
jgi:hypothetical protein